MYISKKEELYTFDELKLISEAVQKSDNETNFQGIIEKLEKLQDSLKENPSKNAVFFMPQNTFMVLSVFQGDNSICKIELQDIEAIYKCISGIEESCGKEVFENKNHILNKIKILLDYLKDENLVFPIIVPADNLKEI